MSKSQSFEYVNMHTKIINMETHIKNKNKKKKKKRKKKEERKH